MIYRSMQHLSITLGILAFGTGIVSLMMIQRYFNKLRLEYLKIYYTYIIVLNIFVLINLIFHYLLTNILSSTGDNLKILLIFSLNIFGYFIFTLLTYFYILFTRKVTGKESSPKTGLLLLLSVVAASLVYGFAIANYLSSLNPGFFLNVHKVFVSVPLILSVGASIILYINASKLNIRSDINRLRLFSIIYTLFYIFQILLSFVPFKTVIVISTFNLLVYNLIPILFLKIFVQNYEKSKFNNIGTKSKVDQLFKKYGLSDRESEIAVLLAAGKSNEEIENEMFISIFTVKKHISNIFIKTDVRSRSQFMKLILDTALEKTTD